MTDKIDPESLDDVFEALMSKDRRLVLNYLQEDEDNFAGIDEISEYIDEAGEASESGRTDLQLHHTHMPRLDRSGLVDYDPRNQEARLNLESGDSRDNILLDYLEDSIGEDATHVDTVFNALSNEVRRRTLYFLEEDQDRKSTVNGIATYLASNLKEPDVPVIGEYEPSEEDINKFKVELDHNHLAKLQDTGWIDYDPQGTGKVSLEIDEDQEPDGLLLKYLEQTYGQEEQY